MESFIFILVLLFGPLVITFPFLALFLIGVVPIKKIWKYVIIIEVILTSIWSFILLTQVQGTPLHIDI